MYVFVLFVVVVIILDALDLCRGRSRASLRAACGGAAFILLKYNVYKLKHIYRFYFRKTIV